MAAMVNAMIKITEKTVIIIGIIIGLFLILAFFGTAVYDVWSVDQMKQNAITCGFYSTASGGIGKECGCSGKLVSDNQPINPLMQGIGGENYYCYGECTT